MDSNPQWGRGDRFSKDDVTKAFRAGWLMGLFTGLMFGVTSVSVGFILLIKLYGQG